MSAADFLPGWVGWLGPAVVAGLGVMTLLLVPGYLLASTRRRLRPELPWTKRAELATEVRVALTFGLLLVPALSFAWVTFFNGPYSRIPDWALIGGAAILSLLVTVTAAWWVMRGPLRQPVPALGRYWWLTVRKWLPAAGLLAIGLAAPSRLGSVWMVPWTLVAVGALFGLRYLAEYLRWSGVARNPDERVAAAVMRAAARAGSPPPAAYVFTSHLPNAFALPVRNLILLSSRLVDELDDAELEAVALHELAHLNERAVVTRRRSLGVLSYLPVLAIKPLLAAGRLVLPTVLIAAVALRMMLQRLDAEEELRADHEAVERAHQATALGSALLKMHRAGLIPAFTKRDPHGPLYDRLLRAGVTPDFARPTQGPRLRRLTAAVAGSVLITFATATALWMSTDIWDDGSGSATAVAFGWRTDEVLWWSSLQATSRGDLDRAGAFLAAAADLGHPDALVALPWALYLAGRCDEAATAAQRAAAADPFGFDPADYAAIAESCSS